jgi:hypothetical protein
VHHIQNTGEETMFLINARDEDGVNRSSGRDDWHVTVVDKNTFEEIPVTISDNDDGTYCVRYSVDAPTEISVDIKIKDHHGEDKHINGCPFLVKFEEPTDETKGLNSIDGNLIVNYIKDTTDEIRNFINEKNNALDIETRK